MSTLRVLIRGVLLGGTLAGVAMAQDQAAPLAPVLLEETIVTAQRREENLQQVPIAATALDAAALEARAVARLADLQTATPSLSITNAGQTQSVNIRGIGLASNSPNATAGVATYVDGLFQPPIVQSNGFYDLASIEVLRGPQGTLVGTSSTGGAIFVNSRNPELGATGGHIQVGLGNFDQTQAEGAINLSAGDSLARSARWPRSSGTIAGPAATTTVPSRARPTPRSAKVRSARSASIRTPPIARRRCRRAWSCARSSTAGWCCAGSAATSTSASPASMTSTARRRRPRPPARSSGTTMRASARTATSST
jgi:outer membrane receptor protein involved in Fe transport